VNAPLESDGGFTLTELLIVVALLGLVTTVLAAALLVFSRNERSVSERLDESRGLQQLVNYLPSDVASAQTLGISPPNDDPKVALCGSGGEVKLHMTWREQFGSPEEYVARVTYRDSGGREAVLTRHKCENGSVSRIEVAREYAFVAVNTLSDEFTEGSVRMTIDFGGARRTIIAQSQNISGGQ
jgi:prepilin-type N-terminal cleavage/methylation domain-containing protein